MADTQAAPQIVKALSGVLPDAAVRQLMQALGNCNQPYTSRGPANFQPNEPYGNNNGVYGGGRWNPANYTNIFPQPGQGPVDVPHPGGTGYPQGGWTGGSATYNNYDGNTFLFPTTQTFGVNNFYGGSTFNVGGNSTFDNVTTNNLTTNYITVLQGGVGGGDQSPGLPGAPGGPGAGSPPGGVSPWPIIFPPIWNRPPRPQGPTGAQPPFTGTAYIGQPYEAELQDDCKIKLKFRRVPVTVSVR
ncbi:MAG: hypothetical protein EBR82_22795 [Caulobacteraceae bacterium]|nr:hypothetical protein [Caulobacteraceae bacterium]